MFPSNVEGAWVRDVHLRNFRNYHELDLELTPGFNLVIGPNAQGKTNLLEALYLLSTTRMLRGQRDAEGILEGEREAFLQATLAPSETEVALKMQAGTRKRALLNGLALPRASDILGRMPSVSISTEEMVLARGEPADRRTFLDLELSTLYPAYLRHLSVYKRAIEHRNALIRMAADQEVSAEMFEPWEDQLAEHGVAIRMMRLGYLEKIRGIAAAFHASMGSNEQLAINYDERDAYAEREPFLNGLASTRGNDIRRGGTSIGPHRDDIGILIGTRELRFYGSQGQQRTAIFALKLASLQVAHSELGVQPILLLDDVLSDLDIRRREALSELVISEAGQVVLTSTDADAAGQEIKRRATHFVVSSGTVRLA